MQVHVPSYSAFRSAAHAFHAQMIQALDALRQRSSPSEQQARWQLLEPALLDHMQLEEALLLPEFDLGLSDQAARIRQEHERIRRLAMHLSEVAPRACLDGALVAELLRLVRECAALEERVLYPWADLRLPQWKKATFVQRTEGVTRAGFGPGPSLAVS